MSAFLVTDAHINVLITFAREEQLVLPSSFAPGTVWLSILNDPQATLVGRALLKENLRSLRHLFGDRHSFIDPLPDNQAYIDRYHFKFDVRGSLMSGAVAIAIIKATHCYDYQTCEAPDYRESWAASCMAAIRDAACYRLPGYDDAPWGFDDLPLH